MNAPTSNRTGRVNLAGPFGVAAVGVALLALLYVRDPHESGSYGVCPFLAVTGRPCPGCGGLRAINLLVRGNVADAMSSNLLAVGLVGLLAVAWMLWVVRRVRRGGRGPMIALSSRASWLMLTVVIVFGVARNTPWGSWLAP